MQLTFLRQRDTERERESWKALGKSWVWKSFFVLSVFVASCFSVGYTRQRSLQGWRSMGWHCLYASKRKWKTSLTQSLPNCRVRRIPSPSVLQHEILLSSSLSHIIDSVCQLLFLWIYDFIFSSSSFGQLKSISFNSTRNRKLLSWRSGLFCTDWLETGNLQRAVMVIASISTKEVLERWNFSIETDADAFDKG